MCVFFLNQHAFTQTRSPSARSFAFTSDVMVSSWYIIYWFVCHTHTQTHKHKHTHKVCVLESKTQGDIAYIQRVMNPHPRTSAMRSALLLASSYLHTHANEETQRSVTSGWFKWPTNNNAGSYSQDVTLQEFIKQQSNSISSCKPGAAFESRVIILRHKKKTSAPPTFQSARLGCHPFFTFFFSSSLISVKQKKKALLNSQ